MSRATIAIVALSVAFAIAWATLWTLAELSPRERLSGIAPPAAAIALAVMGDSDSHGYQDDVFFAADPGARGGALRATTLQWTEVLQRLRADALDPGERAVWGVHGVVARLQAALGVPPARVPRRRDFRFSVAISGASCGDLAGGRRPQVAALLQTMDADPVRWRDGVVSIRIGVNAIGRASSLDAFARDPDAADARQSIDACVDDVRAAVGAIRARHPATRIVLVGLFDNVHWPRYHDRWQAPGALRNIGRAIDRYDDALRAIARDDARIAFFDDRAWFDALWGGRDPATGRPAYREVAVGRTLRVTNTLGDAPTHACVADGHAGTVWNALWARAFVELLNRRFGYAIAPITDDEIVGLLGPGAGPGVR